ncbi:MAG: 4-hydroxy-3-methylbut-2-enyl diphosphate reductase [Fimbriimonadaceae bacterium]|nr:4-hydroxy-3-methylbut-2-enyl diphosphate reductase [Fimbriimonadaceae bacterium]
MERVVLAAPRGFCAGVAYAIDIVNRALDAFGTPLYVRHAIVHNEWVVRSFEDRGVVFVEEIAEVPAGMPVVFSAHGVSPEVREQSRQRGLKIIDATCPLVDKVHREAREWAQRGYTILYIGHEGHVEAEGTMGEAPAQMVLVDNVDQARTLELAQAERLVVLTQTTLSVDEVTSIVEVLAARFPRLRTPRKEDICYATTTRQEAVKALAEQCDMILVVGSTTSSNTNRLREVAESNGCVSYLIGTAEELRPEWVEQFQVIGVTSGASTPELVVDQVMSRLMDLRAVPVDTLKTAEERIHFRAPRELVAAAQGG